ncbi:MAG TPA: MFS transporter [Chloroflexota bacterium]|nr:MFS transporter [Chloroflexota bacterium]
MSSTVWAARLVVSAAFFDLFSQFPLVAPYLADRFGRVRPLAGGLALIAVALLWLAAGGSTGALYGAMAVFGLGFGLLFPAATTLVADATRPHERGLAYGLFYAVYSLGVVAGGLLSGALAAASGPATRAPFAVAALFALAVALTISVRRPAGPDPALRS